MPDTITVNFGWVKPEVGGSNDTWGNKWNSNLDSVDSIVFTKANIAGQAFTGPITAPSIGISDTFKVEYTDAGINPRVVFDTDDYIKFTRSTNLYSLFLGNIPYFHVGTTGIEIGRTDGTASTPSIELHSGATVVDYDSRIRASGGTGVTGGGVINYEAADHQFTGPITLPDADPVSNNIAARKKYVDDTIATKAPLVHTHVISDVTDLQTTLDSKEPIGEYTAINTITDTAYTFLLADKGRLVLSDSAAATSFTVPTNSTQAFPVKSKIDIGQTGLGQLTIVASGGVTILSAGGRLKLFTRYSAATLVKLATDTWWLFGDLTT